MTTTSTARDAIAIALEIRQGQGFTLNGRAYTLYGYSSTSGTDARGEYLRIPVFATGGGYRFVTVRPNSRIVTT